MIYVVFLKTIVKAVPQEIQEAHREYLQELNQLGKMISAGPIEKFGGMVLYKTDSKDEVKTLVEKDPFVSEGYRDYEIYEWKITVGN